MEKFLGIIFSVLHSILFFKKRKWMTDKASALRGLAYARLFKKWGKKNHLGKLGLLEHPECISVGSRNNFDRGLFLTAWTEYRGKKYSPELIVGDDCKFGAYNHISCINKIVIGDGFLSGKWVTIVDNAHGMINVENLQMKPSERDLYSKGCVCIGKNVWVGDKVTILPNVTIGEGAVIAANTVVTKNVPPFSVCVGNPGKIIRFVGNET